MTAITDPNVIKALTDAGGQLWQKKGKRRIWTTIDVLFTMADAVPVSGAVTVGETTLLPRDMSDYTRPHLINVRMGLDLDTGTWTLTNSVRLNNLLEPRLNLLLISPKAAGEAAERGARRAVLNLSTRKIATLKEEGLLEILSQNCTTDDRQDWADTIARNSKLPRDLLTVFNASDPSVEAPGADIQTALDRTQRKAAERYKAAKSWAETDVLSEHDIRSVIGAVDKWIDIEPLITQKDFPMDFYLRWVARSPKSRRTARLFATSKNPLILRSIASSRPDDEIIEILSNNPCTPLDTMLLLSDGKLTQGIREHVDMTSERLAELTSTNGEMAPGFHAVLVNNVAGSDDILNIVRRKSRTTSAEQLHEWTKYPAVMTRVLLLIISHPNVSEETLTVLSQHLKKVVANRALEELSNRASRTPD